MAELDALVDETAETLLNAIKGPPRRQLFRGIY